MKMKTTTTTTGRYSTGQDDMTLKHLCIPQNEGAVRKGDNYRAVSGKARSGSKDVTQGCIRRDEEDDRFVQVDVKTSITKLTVELTCMYVMYIDVCMSCV